MVKAPSSSFASSHNKSSYGDKFKSWRKGKGKTKAGGGSLKHRLRGLERLLQKQNDEERRAVIQKSIDDIHQQIQERDRVEKERANAKKSHKARFLDRQRLVRLWQKLDPQQDNKDDDDDNDEQSKKQRYQLAWDMLYVAHFPHAQMSYQSLYSTNKKRHLARGRALAKIVSARQAICQQFGKQNSESKQQQEQERVAWVPQQIYNDMNLPPADWSVQKERETFDYPTAQQQEQEQKPPVNDDRFKTNDDNENTVTASQQKVLEAAQAIEAELDRQDEEEAIITLNKDDADDDLALDVAHAKQILQKEEENDGSSDDDSASSSSSSDDEADPLASAAAERSLQKKENQESQQLQQPQQQHSQDQTDGSSSSDYSSSDDEDSSLDNGNDALEKRTAQQDQSSSSSSSSSSSDSDSSDDDDDDDGGQDNKRKSDWSNDLPSKKVKENTATEAAQAETVNMLDASDGFLMAAAPNDEDAFANAKQHIPERATGDKSQGWATQRQRPGDFRGKRNVRHHPQDRWRR